MPFCSKCGAQVTGPFCGSCGTPAAAPSAPQPSAQQPYQAPSQPAFQAVQPQYAAPGGPAKKGKGPLFWTLIGCGGLIVIAVLLMVGGGFFAASKLKQAGLDQATMERNPEMAAAKLIVTMNPKLELVSTDEAAGTMTIREKETGKTITVNFADIKRGKISFSGADDKGEAATMEFGGTDAKLPSWVPSYPGAKAEGAFAVKGGSAGENGGSVHFKTTDTAAQVLTFYQDKLKDARFTIKLNSTTPTGGMVVGENESTKQTISVVIGTSSGETGVQVTYSDKSGRAGL